MAGRTAIGLDIGTSSVRAAQVTVAKGSAVLDRFGQVGLPPGAVRDGEVADPDAVADALKVLWSRAKFTKKDVVLGISNQKVFVRLVQVPWMPESELRASLKFQVADLVPMPIDEAVLDFVPLEETTAESSRLIRGLLVAASEDMVLGSIRACQKAGLKVTTADLTPFAVLRSAGTNDPLGLSGPEAVVDVGARVTNIVVHEAGVPKFVRILLLGGDDITGVMVERLGIPTAEAERLKRDHAALSAPAAGEAKRVIDQALAEFVDEVRGSVDYYIATSGSRPLSRLVLSGGGSLADGLAQRLATAVRTQVEYGRAFQTLTVGKTGLAPEQVQFVEPLAAVPVGLAMGAV
ncbi:MAG: type IV pilus assembly protein PilM [Frankiales bacterium]|nr:type IV pilus assembly protein PilM [Frankiales bacterium]